MRHVRVTDKIRPWWSEFRTPLGLIEEENGSFTLFFTATGEDTDYWQHMGEEGYVLDTGFDTMGLLRLKLI
jgi:hypothetical protein